MKKKMYEKPSLEVVKVQASVAMLAGSPTGTEDYQWNDGGKE